MDISDKIASENEYMVFDKTVSAKLYIAGDYDKAVTYCGLFCDEYGFCVNIQKTKYVYTLGQEDGVVVELIGYPRFKETFNRTYIKERMLTLASILKNKLNQKSYTLQISYNYDGETHYVSDHDRTQ